MNQLTEFQKLLVRLLKGLKVDKAAILFIILALESDSAQGAMALFIKDNPQATHEELMQAAVDYQQIAEELNL